MRADYDSQADALSIELVDVARFDRQEQVDEDCSSVGILDDRVVDVELLYPARNLQFLGTVAQRYDLDSEELLAAAQAALAAPDRVVTVDVAIRSAA